MSNYDNCIKALIKEKDKAFQVASEAKAKGIDPLPFIEIGQAEDLADRVEKLVGPKGCAKRIRELMEEEKKDRDKTALRIIDEILEGRFGKDEKIKLGEQAIRTAITLLTEGIVVAGTEGISRVEIQENEDGSKYLAIFFASPIRSAGGTAGGYAAMLADYVRKKLGLDRYKPTEKEIDRYVEEIFLYNSAISRLQYLPKEEDIRHIVKNCPVCVTGDSTSQVEVSVNRNLKRVPTNKVRGGMCLVMAESLAQKAPKLLKISKKLELGWDWLEGLVKITKTSSEKEEIKPIDKYLKEVVGGRPIFSYPSRPGGFRLRYGRARNTGINARAIHPAAMYVLDEFPAVGTQFKVERPKKGCAVVPCDSIEPPVVRLKNGDVIIVDNVEKAARVREEIEEILFLGDMLVSYGDFINANHPIIPSPICEEWWQMIAESKGIKTNAWQITSDEALKLSKERGLPLHPKFTYFYHDVSKEDLLKLIFWLKKGEVEEIESFEGVKKRLAVRVSEEKRILELLCVPHKLRDEFVIIEDCEPLIESLGIKKPEEEIRKVFEQAKDSMDFVNKLAGFKIYKKSTCYIGTRMGRPEKAKERKMSPPVHGLFPVRDYGGKMRNIIKAAENEKIIVDAPFLVCPKCGKELMSYKCPECNERALIRRICSKCGAVSDSETCPKCGGKTLPYKKKIINLKKAIEQLRKKGISVPEKVKGVIGTTNAEKYFEPLEKAFLRAAHNVFCFKDATSRFDATNLPLTHFKPYEINVSVEKLRELGYETDYIGEKLEREDQVVELFPQDIVIPEAAADYFVRVSQFIDEMLEKVYGLPAFYNVKKKEDLIGHLVVEMAPHISAGILGRIVGFSKARGLYAHPLMHCATRRDCDGDENSVVLLLDALINFSRKYIPEKPGGTEDVISVLTITLRPEEVDDQAHDIETCKLPIEFYEESQNSKIKTHIPIIKDFLGTRKALEGIDFMFDTKQIDEGPSMTSYSKIKTMAEKVEKQLQLAEKIRAVDEKDVAEKVINSHFLRDIYGNLRSFGQQLFRCVDCNAKYRRVPLVGKCTKCGGKIILTIHKGGIEKYLKVSQEIAEKYNLTDYLKQRLKLIETDIEEIFKSSEEEQEDKAQASLADFI